MPSPTRGPRRSPRLLGAPSEDASAPPRKRPRTEPKLRSKQKQNLRNRKPSAIINIRNATLLSLPDEALSHILHLLGATNTGGSFQGPRHAFTLAQANTRLLRLFSNLITRITPDVNNNSPRSLSVKHIFAVSRLAANNLREVHLPIGGFEILPELCEVCPRLEALSVVDDNDNDVYSSHLKHALRLPLHSLAIDSPSSNTIRCLKTPLPHLKLTNIFEEQCHVLMSYLRHPPKTLHLEMHTDADTSSEIDPFLACISAACPKMEALSLSMPCDDYESDSEEDELFQAKAQELISLARQNRNQSRCKSMKLRGSRAFQILEKAHPEAVIELGRKGYTFGDEGDGFYASRLEIDWKPPPAAVDLSRVTELSIRYFRIATRHLWQRVLRSAKLKRVYMEKAWIATYLDVRADVVVIPLWSLCQLLDESEAYHKSEYLDWFSHGARELRIVEAYHVALHGRVVDCLKTLTFVLDAFGGEVLWMDTLCRLHAKSERDGIYRVRPAFRAALRALDRFEGRGGDAGTVRAELAAMVWTGNPRRCLCSTPCR